MSESEAILLQRFAGNGDAEAFSEIVRRHAGLVYGACLRVLEDRTKAADATQETFFQLVQHAGEITGSVASWLHRVATRKAIDIIRRDSTRKRREAGYAADKPREAAKWEDISLYVDESLAELDEEIREILIHHFFEGRSATEIAGEKGISQPTVSRRIEGGVSQLREKLRRRGVIVAVITLGGLLGESAAEAAPAIVLKELGKMALVGGQAAAASGAKAAGGLLAGMKAKVITATAVAAVSVGGVVTYNQVARKVEQPAQQRGTQPSRQVQDSTDNTRTVVRPRQTTYEAKVAGESLPDEMGQEESIAGSIAVDPVKSTDSSSSKRPVTRSRRRARRASGGTRDTRSEEKTDTEKEPNSTGTPWWSN